MKNTVFTLAFLFFATLTMGQVWAPTGATWYYEIVYPGPQVSYIKYQSIGDTVLLGQACKIIAVTGGTTGCGYLAGNSDTAFTY